MRIAKRNGSPVITLDDGPLINFCKPAVDPLFASAAEIWGNGKTKDYPLWFWAGQQVLQGKPLYPSDPNAYFEFIYPPLPAILLALPSALGKIPLYLGLSLLNAAAWWMTSQLSNALAGSGRISGAWIAAARKRGWSTGMAVPSTRGFPVSVAERPPSALV